MQPRLVQDFLEQSAARLPGKTALVCGAGRWTYAELDNLANRFANALRRLGVQRGDRVGICLQNSHEAVVALFGTLKADAVFVMIHPSTKQAKIRYILDNCRASALVADTKSDVSGIVSAQEGASVASLLGCFLVGPLPPALASLPQATPWTAALEAETPTRPTRTGVDLDLACLIYTSGSTGEPKGVMSDHSNVVFAASSITDYVGNVESDVVLNVLPLSFDYGLYQVLMILKTGGTLVLERSFTFPAAVLKIMERERVTGFPGVPTLFAILLQLDLSGFDLSALRYLTNTAANLPVSHIQEIRNKFPNATLFSMYGLTETKRTLYLPPAELDRRPGSVGIPIPGTEAWLVDDDGRRLPPGSTGELVVRGRHVMRGYWEAPDATAARYRPGPLPGERVCHTGDLFRTDAEGYFYFVSRKDEIIKSRGEKVSPKEVESVLYGIPGVVEAVVVGEPDPILGQAIKALIVVQGRTLTANEVLAHCRKHLEDLMVPKIVEFRDELPKTSSGKLTRRQPAP
jgi:amino acid adenylation domain-containing protein